MYLDVQNNITIQVSKYSVPYNNKKKIPMKGALTLQKLGEDLKCKTVADRCKIHFGIDHHRKVPVHMNDIFHPRSILNNANWHYLPF